VNELPPPTDIALRINRAVAFAIEKYRMGEPTDYMVQLNWTPTPEGMRLAWNIGLVQKSPLLGQKNLQMIIDPEPDPSDEKIDKAVQENLEQLRQLRTQQLRIGNGSK
jgi:hypothetical protein